MAISPYKSTEPTTDDMFFGREREIREITDQAKTTSFAIIGGRWIGKTSFLFRLHLNSLPSQGIRTVYHDCTITPTYEEFMAAHPKKWQPELEPGNHLPATFSDLLQSPPTDMPLVMLLDEVDKLLSVERDAHWPLFNALRASANLGQMHVILCGERALRSALKDESSPLFNFVNEMYLGPLDYSDVKKLVARPMQRMGISLEDEEAIVKRIWDFTSGHPNVVQRLCHRLIGRVNAKMSRHVLLNDVIEVINDPEFQEVDFLETYLSQASPLECIIVLLMATSKGDKLLRLQDVVNLLAANEFTPSVESIRDALAQLTELRSILKRDQTSYTFAVKAFPQVSRDRIAIEPMLSELKSKYNKWGLEDKRSITNELSAAPILASQKKFDVFLNYNSMDRTWVTSLKEALQGQGLLVWLDHDEIRPGDLFVDTLERGLEESKVVALIVSPESMESGWVEEEYSRALSISQFKRQSLHLIPVILRGAELPGFLASRNWVDFSEELKFTQNLELLIWGITGKRPTLSTEYRETILFQAGSPLSDGAPLYIERKADQEALIYLRRMDYISFIAPRLQGKTSLIYRLMKRLTLQGYEFVICDLANERFRKESEEEWYKSLSTWILKTLSFIDPDDHISLPTHGMSWEKFLIDIARAAKETKRRIVIVLDTLQDMPSAYATPFFTVIRSIYTERAIFSAFEYLTFITSGVFDPEELIQDKTVSKFNVDQRIELEDFNLAQVRQLVDNLHLPDNIAETIAKRVYYWTNGQTYLTQKLCLLLQGVPELIQSSQLDIEIDRLAKQLFEDIHYVQRIITLREREPSLFDYAQSISSGHKPKFNQVLNKQHFRLANIYGVIKADLNGQCQISNRVCEQAFTAYSLTLAENEMFVIEANWHEWASKITKALKNLGKVSPNTISIIPEYLWTRVMTKYKEESTELTVIFSQGELRLERGAQWIERWNQASTAAHDMLSSTRTIEQTELLKAMTNVISEATGLRWDNQWHTMGILYGTKVVAHVLRLSIPRRFPIIFVPPTAITPDIDDDLIRLCNLMQLRQFFSLVFTLETDEDTSSSIRLRKILQNSLRIDQFIVLTKDDLFRIFTASNPVSQIVQCIMSDSSPSAYSPFATTDYVTGRMFFGHDREIRDITSGLTERSFAVVGNRRIGKSSLLHQVKTTLEESQMYSLTLLNLQGTFDLAGLYRYLDEELYFQVDKVEPEAFRAFVDYLASQAEGRRVVLLIDEPDALLLHDKLQPFPRPYSLSWIWRELSQNGRCRFVFAGHRVLTRILRDGSSPYFNFGERIPLGFLEQSDAHDLLTAPLHEMGIELADPDDILDRVWLTSAGHPSVIQLIGRELLKCLRRGERIVRFEHLEQVLSSGAFEDEYSSTIWGEWGSGDTLELQGVSPLERAILLLGDSEGFTEATILVTLDRRGFHIKDEAVYDALDMLVAFGLLTCHEQVYTCTVPYFIDLFRRKHRMNYWLNRYKNLVNK